MHINTSLLELSTHDATPHQLPVAQVVELAPLILTVEGSCILLNSKVKIPLDVLEASSEEQEPSTIWIKLKQRRHHVYSIVSSTMFLELQRSSFSAHCG